MFQRDNNGNISQRDNRTQNWSPTPNNQVPNRQTPNMNPQTRPAPNVNPQTLPAPNTNPQPRPAPNVNQPNRQQPASNINRDMQLRDRGTDRANNFNQSQTAQARPAANQARPAG
ncbi:hypothetical protein MEO93_26710 [Dolichospermum sp. ST_sed3]|nr:hypothetical protein [Dolichospermum sp. ST_sed3]